MSETSNALCTVCRRQRHKLTPRKSKLKTNQTMFLCEECYAEKREPRYLIVLMARSQGLASVRDYIRQHRYYGDKIRAEELV
jgi:hypothetical protein